MMVAPERQANLNDLIEAACENRLSAEDAASLEQLLVRDCAARRTYLTCMHAQSLLERFDAARPDHVPPKVACDTQAERPRFSLRRLSGFLADYRRHPERVSLTVALTVVLAVVVVLAFLRPSLTGLDDGDNTAQNIVSRPEATGVATLTATADAVWKGKEPSTGHLGLEAGQQLQLATGLAKVMFAHGSEVILEGPVDFVVRNVNAGCCASGRLVARVPSRATGFVIETQAARITDLGTEFGVAVDAKGAVDVTVFDGFVEITPVAFGDVAPVESQRVLSQGQQVRVVAGKVEVVAADAGSGFVRQMPSGADGDDDTPRGLVGYWDFDSLRGNLVLDRSGFSGSAVASPRNLRPELVDGRFGKALKSGKPLQGVRIRNRVPQKFTLSLWVKTSSATPQGDLAFNGVGLLWADVPNDHNDFVLTLLNDNVWFHDGATAALLAERVFVAGTSKINDDGWHHIAVVRQGDLGEAGLRIYVDGQLEAAGLSGASPLRDCPTITVGFNPDRSGAHHNLPFDGLIDDLAIFGRALTDQELAVLAEGKQPAGALFGGERNDEKKNDRRSGKGHGNAAEAR